MWVSQIQNPKYKAGNRSHKTSGGDAYLDVAMHDAVRVKVGHGSEQHSKYTLSGGLREWAGASHCVKKRWPGSEVCDKV